MQVPGTSGTLELLIPVEEGEVMQGPEMLPGGEWVLLTARAAGQASCDEAQMIAQSVTSSERTVLIDGGRDGRYLPTGHLVYSLNNVLFVVPFNVESLQVTGGTIPLVEGVGAQFLSVSSAHFSTSTNGALVYVSPSETVSSLVWVGREGEVGMVPLPPAAYRNPEVSPDGDLITYVVGGGAWSSNWTLDLQRQVPQRLHFEGSQGVMKWSPDKSRYVFAADPTGGTAYYMYLGATDSPEVSQLTSTRTISIPGAWPPEGEWVVYTEANPDTDDDLWVVRADGSEVPRLFRGTPAQETQPSVSRNGRWIAYRSDRPGDVEILVEPFPSSGVATQVSASGGTKPVWSKDGRELYYRADGYLYCGAYR